jgi:hypothetical protein
MSKDNAFHRGETISTGSGRDSTFLLDRVAAGRGPPTTRFNSGRCARSRAGCRCGGLLNRRATVRESPQSGRAGRSHWSESQKAETRPLFCAFARKPDARGMQQARSDPTRRMRNNRTRSSQSRFWLHTGLLAKCRRQWALQLEGLGCIGRKPKVDLFGCHQDDRHGFGVKGACQRSFNGRHRRARCCSVRS